MSAEALKFLGAGVVTAGAITVASVLYYWNGSNSKKGKQLVYSKQSVEQPDGSRISCLLEDGVFLHRYFEDVSTLYEAIQRGARVSNTGRFLGYKPSSIEPYIWISYQEALTRAEHVGAGLVALGLEPSNTSRVGIFSQNRPEYVITNCGLWGYCMVAVPFYDILSTEACIHIVNQAEISVMVCDTNSKVKNLLHCYSQTPSLRVMVVMAEIDEECRELALNTGIKMMQFTELEKLGRENPVPLNLPKPDDLCTVCYTSGTTVDVMSSTMGIPKGAMLTHQGMIAASSAAITQITAADVKIDPDDVMVSYLPLAHSYEQMIHGVMYMVGAQVGFFQGDVRNLMSDLKELQPTVFPCVPRLLNRLYDKVSSSVNSNPIKRFLFNMALRSKDAELKRHVIRKDSIWDRFVFKAVQTALGGRVRLITSGSAPLSTEVMNFLRCIMGCPIVEGYGQTECHAICCLQLIGDYSCGTVGPPLCSNAIKLMDIPEMQYYSKDNKGEVCVKGTNVFGGYLKDEGMTREVLDDDGWLHTGDVGQWMENGSLKIIDRKKHIFKLSQGEYIMPEKIENICIQNPLIAQMFVHGESLKSCLVGVVVPDEDCLTQHVADGRLSVGGMSFEEMCRNQDVKKCILDGLTATCRKAGLLSFEIVKDIYLHPEMFSVENGLLTPTFKSKRSDLVKLFNQQIADMYIRL